MADLPPSSKYSKGPLPKEKSRDERLNEERDRVYREIVEGFEAGVEIVHISINSAEFMNVLEKEIGDKGYYIQRSWWTGPRGKIHGRFGEYRVTPQKPAEVLEKEEAERQKEVLTAKRRSERDARRAGQEEEAELRRQEAEKERKRYAEERERQKLELEEKRAAYVAKRELNTKQYEEKRRQEHETINTESRRRTWDIFWIAVSISTAFVVCIRFFSQ